MSDNIFWVLEAAIKEDELGNFKSLMKEMVNATKANEPDAINYEFFISEDGKSCHIYERYNDSAAVMTHLGTFGQKFTDRFMATVKPVRFTVYGNPSDEVKKALGSMGAVFLAPSAGFAR